MPKYYRVFQNWFRLSGFVRSEAVWQSQCKSSVSFSRKIHLQWVRCGAEGRGQSTQCCPHRFPFPAQMRKGQRAAEDTYRQSRHHQLCWPWAEKGETPPKGRGWQLQGNGADAPLLRRSEFGSLPLLSGTKRCANVCMPGMAWTGLACPSSACRRG